MESTGSSWPVVGSISADIAASEWDLSRGRVAAVSKQ